MRLRRTESETLIDRLLSSRPFAVCVVLSGTFALLGLLQACSADDVPNGQLAAATTTTADAEGSMSSSPPSTASGRSSLSIDPLPTTSAVPFWARVPSLPESPFAYDPELPDHFLMTSGRGPSVIDLDSTPADNVITDAGAALGRVLFYDVNLSRSRMISCASCHVQQHAFTDPLMPSRGVAGVTRRNSMSLSNAAFNRSGRFLWDEAASTLEEQVIKPLSDPVEMGLTNDEVSRRVGELDYYEPLLVNAFGDADATIDRVAAALAQFIRSMVSAEAPYDEGRALVERPTEPFPNFSESENRGKALFFGDVASGGGSCSACHVGDAQLNRPDGLRNNGIDARSTTDFGGFEITGDPTQRGAFRVPSLRNIEVSGPYMHDGRFFSLEEVVEHYNSGIQPHPNLADELRNADGTPIRMGFTADEKAALVDFLETLTDEAFLTDDRFRSPFRQ